MRKKRKRGVHCLKHDMYIDAIKKTEDGVYKDLNKTKRVADIISEVTFYADLSSPFGFLNTKKTMFNGKYYGRKNT